MMLTTSRRALGVFSSYKELENALNELRTLNFPMNQISVIGRNSDDLNENAQMRDVNTQDLTDTTKVDEGAKTGAATGGALGALTGLLVGLGAVAIPGVGPIMLAGATATALATTLAGSAIGAAAGSLVGGLIGLGIPEERARVYHGYIIRGNYLVIVDGTEAEIRQAEAVFQRRGIQEWEIHPAATV